MLKYLMTLILMLWNRVFGNTNTELQLTTVTKRSVEVLIGDDGTLHIDFSNLPFDKINISGINKIKFSDSIKIESDKHLGLCSGHNNKEEIYKIVSQYNLENPNESLEDYVKRIKQEALMERIASGKLVEERVISNLPVKKKIEIKKGDILKSTITKNYDES